MTPQVRVLRGSPDDVELAALVAGIVVGRAVGPHDDAGAAARRRREADGQRRWRDAAVRLSPALTPGRDAWRWSGRD